MKKFTNAYQVTYDVDYKNHPYFATTSAVRVTDLTNGNTIVVLKSNEDDRTTEEWESEMIEQLLSPSGKVLICGVYLTDRYVDLDDETIWYFNIFNKMNPIPVV